MIEPSTARGGEASTVGRGGTGACAGFSIVEMLVALGVAVAVTAAVLGLAMSARNMFDADQSRTHVLHSLRAGRDFVAVDLRQAGERLTPDFPAVLITDGASGAPDQLYVRRNLLDAVLPVCESVSGTLTSFKIAVTASPPAGCAVGPDDDADGWPDNLEAWRDWRIAEGGTGLAYIYDPVTGDGEFFQVVSEDQALLELVAHSTTNWSNSYPVANQPRVYVIEQKRYELNGDLLRVVTNKDTAGAANLVDRISDFQVTAHFSDGSSQTTLGHGDAWRDLRAIEVLLRATDQRANGTIDETHTVEVMPRNILSR